MRTRGRPLRPLRPVVAPALAAALAAAVPAAAQGPMYRLPAADGPVPAAAVAAAPLALAAAPDLPAEVAQGVAVSGRYVASGGVAPYSFATGDAPAGLSWATDATSATLSGVPSAAGANASATLLVTDASVPPRTARLATRAFSLLAPDGPPLTVLTDLNLSTAYARGAFANAQFRASGGTPPYAFSQQPLVAGLGQGTADAGYGAIYFQGFPSRAGANPATTITVTDSSVPPLVGTLRTTAFDLVEPAAAAPLAVTPNPDFASRVAAGTQVVAYFHVSGGTPPYALTPPASVAPGLAPSVQGAGQQTVVVFYGTPTRVGANPGMSFTVTDSSVPPVSATFATAAFEVYR